MFSAHQIRNDELTDVENFAICGFCYNRRESFASFFIAKVSSAGLLANMMGIFVAVIQSDIKNITLA